MSDTFTPGPTPNGVRAADGRVLTAPEGWMRLPPGDAALTRRVKDAGNPITGRCQNPAVSIQSSHLAVVRPNSKCVMKAVQCVSS